MQTTYMDGALVQNRSVWCLIKLVSDLRQVGGFLRVLRFPPPINWPPWYSWNIVESVVKHQKAGHGQCKILWPIYFQQHIRSRPFFTIVIQLLRQNREITHIWLKQDNRRHYRFEVYYTTDQCMLMFKTVCVYCN